MDNIEFRFIEPELKVPKTTKLQPASYIRKTFYEDDKVIKATLYTTGLGVYIPFFNGHDVSTSMLMPGFTNYNKRVQYFSVDVQNIFAREKMLFLQF